MTLCKRNGNSLILSKFKLPYKSLVYTPPQTLHNDGMLIGEFDVAYTKTNNYKTYLFRTDDNNIVDVIWFLLKKISLINIEQDDTFSFYLFLLFSFEVIKMNFAINFINYEFLYRGLMNSIGASHIVNYWLLALQFYK